jgi:hypothetical protein
MYQAEVFVAPDYLFFAGVFFHLCFFGMAVFTSIGFLLEIKGFMFDTIDPGRESRVWWSYLPPSDRYRSEESVLEKKINARLESSVTGNRALDAVVLIL